MTYAFISFGVSLVAMIVMLNMKLHEIKLGRYLLFPTLRERSDQYLKRVLRSVERFTRIISSKKFWIALTVFLAREFHDHVIKHPKVTTTTKKVADVVRGRKVIKSK